MKNTLLITLIFAGFLLAFTNCEDEIPDYEETTWFSYATLLYDTTTSEHTFSLDGGGIFEPTNDWSLDYYEDTSRVVVYFILVSQDTINEELLITGEITYISEITTKDIIQLTEEIADSIGDDYVFTGEDYIWSSDFHLNIIFAFYGYNQSHDVSLVKPIGEQKDSLGNQILEFRHNAYDDWEEYYKEFVVAFNMGSIQEPGADSVNYVMKVVNGDEYGAEYYGTFYFNGENETVSKSAVAKVHQGSMKLFNQ